MKSLKKVVILGAGPAGSTCAAVLKRLGFPEVLIVERRAFPRDKYSWPTALIEVRDIFTISGSDSGEDTVIGSQLVVSDDAGGIDSWTLS